DVTASSGVIARGNENNAHAPDGIYYLGPGQTDGYAVVNLGTRYQLHPRLAVFGQVDNLLNSSYVTGAQLGATGITAAGTLIARPFSPVNGRFGLLSPWCLPPG